MQVFREDRLKRNSTCLSLAPENLILHSFKTTAIVTLCMRTHHHKKPTSPSLSAINTKHITPKMRNQEHHIPQTQTNPARFSSLAFYNRNMYIFREKQQGKKIKIACFKYVGERNGYECRQRMKPQKAKSLSGRQLQRDLRF